MDVPSADYLPEVRATLDDERRTLLAGFESVKYFALAYAEARRLADLGVDASTAAESNLSMFLDRAIDAYRPFHEAFLRVAETTVISPSGEPTIQIGAVMDVVIREVLALASAIRDVAFEHPALQHRSFGWSADDGQPVFTFGF